MKTMWVAERMMKYMRCHDSEDAAVFVDARSAEEERVGVLPVYRTKAAARKAHGRKVGLFSIERDSLI